LPLDAGRKAGAAATPQPGLGDFGHDLRGLHAQRIAQTGQASETGVFVQREGIDDAAPGEGQPGLPGDERDPFRIAKIEGMRAALEPSRIEQPGYVPWLYRAIGDTAGAGFDLDHRLQKIGAARTVAHDLGLDTARRQFAANLLHDLFRAQSKGAGISRNINARLHERTSATISETFSASIRPMTSPSSSAAGEQAHMPRQYTGSRVTLPSPV